MVFGRVCGDGEECTLHHQETEGSQQKLSQYGCSVIPRASGHALKSRPNSHKQCVKSDCGPIPWSTKTGRQHGYDLAHQSFTPHIVPTAAADRATLCMAGLKVQGKQGSQAGQQQQLPQQPLGIHEHQIERGDGSASPSGNRSLNASSECLAGALEKVPPPVQDEHERISGLSLDHSA